MNRHLLSHLGSRFLWFCAIILLFTVTWISLVNARPEQSPNAATISISSANQTIGTNTNITYNINYDQVTTSTGGVRGIFASGFTVTSSNPAADTIPGSGSGGANQIWYGSTTGASGSIAVTGQFQPGSCVSGVYTHTVGIYDTHSNSNQATGLIRTTLTCPNEINGTVFNDRNRDATQETNDLGMAGISISLESTDGTTRSTTTNSNGFYKFTGLSAATYTVKMATPDDRTNTTDSSKSVNLTSGQSSTNNFGLAKKPQSNTGVIGGTTCFDLNGDSRCGLFESRLSIRLLLVLFGGRSPDNGEVVAEITSDSDGSYVFEDVPVGSYQIKPDLPAELVGSVPALIPVIVSDQGTTSVSFPTASNDNVTGVVFSDLDGNGIQSALETGHSGLEVTLKRDGAIDSTTTTNSNGQFQFDGIDSNSSYTVEISSPSGKVATTATSQSIAPRDPANFGLVDSDTLIGAVFVDLNGNGIQDPTEAGLSGVSIELSGGSLTEAMRTTTSDSGTYKFSNVPAGEYNVTQSGLSGYVNHDSNTKQVTMVANGSASATFALLSARTISGMAFNDLNGNGTQDGAEPAFSGATIELLHSSRNVVDTTTTLANGNYQFSDLADGQYTVKVTVPTGLSATTSGEVSATISNSRSAVAIFGLGQVPTAVSEPSLINAESSTNGFSLVMLLSVALVVALKLMPRRKK